MKNLKDTKDTTTMHLPRQEMCIFAQDKPYKDTDLMMAAIIHYSVQRDFAKLATVLKEIDVVIEPVYDHADGILLDEKGVKIEKFFYISSIHTNKFSINGRTNLKEALHTSALKYLQHEGVIDEDRSVQKNDSSEVVVLPERSGLEG